LENAELRKNGDAHLLENRVWKGSVYSWCFDPVSRVFRVAQFPGSLVEKIIGFDRWSLLFPPNQVEELLWRFAACCDAWSFDLTLRRFRAKWDKLTVSVFPTGKDREREGVFILQCPSEGVYHQDLPAKEPLETILDGLPLLVSYIGRDLRYAYVNHAYQEWFSADREDILGKPVVSLIGADAFGRHYPYFRAALMGRFMQYQTEITYPGQGPRNIKVRLVPHKNAKGEILGTINMVEDCTVQTRLSEEARNLAMVVEETDNLVVITQADGAIQWVNRAFIETTGYEMEDILGKRPGQFLQGEESSRRVAEEMRGALEKGDSFRGEILNYRKDGTPFWMEINFKPVNDASGQVERYVSIQRDITERKQVESRLHLLSSALEAAANGVAITRFDGTIEWINGAFSRMTGYQPSEILHQNPRVLKSGTQGEEFYQQMWQTILEGRVWSGEIVNQRKDGSLYHEEMTITPVRNRQGEVTHFIAIKTDISERKRQEDQTYRIHAAVHDALDAVMLMDQDHKIIYCNKAFTRLVGYRTEDLGEEGIQKLFDVSMARGISHLITSEKNYTKVKEWETEIQTFTGQPIPVLVKISPILDAKGRDIGSALFIHDLTQRNQAEKERSLYELQLRQAQKL